jgi:hypothetical protein
VNATLLESGRFKLNLSDSKTLDLAHDLVQKVAQFFRITR